MTLKSMFRSAGVRDGQLRHAVLCLFSSSFNIIAEMKAYCQQNGECRREMLFHHFPGWFEKPLVHHECCDVCCMCCVCCCSCNNCTCLPRKASKCHTCCNCYVQCAWPMEHLLDGFHPTWNYWYQWHWEFRS